MSMFKTIIDGGVIEAAALDTLKKWLPTDLAEMERQKGLPQESLPHVRSWTTVNDFEKWPEDQLPTVLLISTGLADTPTKDGSGEYTAKWVLGLGIVTSANTQEATMMLAKVYAAAIRATLLQRPSLGGVCIGTNWVDEQYTDLPPEDGRTLASARLVFVVEVDDVTTTKAGPTQPDPEADHHASYPDDPLAEDVSVDGELEEVIP